MDNLARASPTLLHNTYRLYLLELRQLANYGYESYILSTSALEWLYNQDQDAVMLNYSDGKQAFVKDYVRGLEKILQHDRA